MMYAVEVGQIPLATKGGDDIVSYVVAMKAK